MSSVSRDAHRTTPADLPRESAGVAGSRLRWLVDRVRTMEPAEVAVRVRQVARIQLDIAARAALGDAPRARRSDVADRDAGPLVLSRARAQRCRRIAPGQAASFSAAARRFADGEFQFLGAEPIILERPLAYETDPVSGERWPRRHGLMLDYRSTTVGDPKWIWELNRLQHIPALLAAALLADDDRLAQIAVADLWIWLSQAAPGQGIAWSNAYEPGLRAISLALALDALRDDRIGEPGLRDALCRSLRRHVRFIERYPSLYTSANNHRVGELVGVIVAGVLAPELGLAAHASRALEELGRRCDEQFAPDGSHREQAFGYAVFTAELVLLAAGVLERAGRPVPTWLDAVSDRVAVALATQLGAGDPEPRYGDRDDGGPTLLGIPATRSGRSLLSALRLARANAIEHPEELDLSALWLFGDTAGEPTRAEPDDPAVPAASAWLRDAGIALLRAGETTVSIDVGPLGYGKLAAHGHADALHVTVSHGGQMLVGDPGTGSYFGNPAVREAFRSTAYHATVLVDDRNQADSAGPFLWGRPPRVDVLALDLDHRVVAAEHDGYARLPDRVVHRRAIALLDEGMLIVHDTLTTAGRHECSQRWPLVPGAEVAPAGPGRLVVNVADVSATLVAAASAPLRETVVTGATEPLEGWWSDGLESVRPAPLARFDATADGELELVTVLALDPTDPHLHPDVTLEVDFGARTATIGGARSWSVRLGDEAGLRVMTNSATEAMR